MKKKIVITYKKYFATIKKTLKYLIKCKVYKYANNFLILYNYHYLSSKFIMFTPLQMLSLQKKVPSIFHILQMLSFVHKKVKEK